MGKPLAPTSREAAEIVDSAAALNRVLAVGHIFVYRPGIVHLRQEITANALEACATWNRCGSTLDRLPLRST